MKILTEDFDNEKIPDKNPRISAVSSLRFLARYIDRKKIHIKPAFTNESTRASLS